MKIGIQTWGSEGDISPFSALAAALVAAGHEVTLVVTDNLGRDYKPIAARHGFTLVAVPMPAHNDPIEEARVWRELFAARDPMTQLKTVLAYGFDPVLEDMYAASKALCASNDVVIGHFFLYQLRVAAEKSGIPAITVNLVHSCVPSAQISPAGLPDLGTWFYPLGWALVRKMINRIFLPRVNALRKQEGLLPDTDVATQTWVSPLLNLIAVSPQVCKAPSDWAKQHQVCGFLNLPKDASIEGFPDGLGAFIADGPPPVYFTFGSMMAEDPGYVAETVAIWIKAIELAGCRAIIQLPASQLDLISTGPAIFKLSRAPHAQVFPRCSVVVHHGGAGTTQSSLLAGCPAIVVAHIGDQFFWGDELKRLGVGGKVLKRRSLNSRQLAAAIKAVVSDPTKADSAKKIARSMAGEGGADTAVTLIERALAQGAGEHVQL